MNSQNQITPLDELPPFYLDTTEADFISWFRSLSPTDRQLFADMLTDIGEMTAEGDELPEIRQYLRRNYPF